MREGYYYKHDAAPDLYIEVLKVFPIKAGEWRVKCDVYTMLSPMPWETTSFRLTKESRRFWKLYTPR